MLVEEFVKGLKRDGGAHDFRHRRDNKDRCRCCVGDNDESGYGEGLHGAGADSWREPGI